MPSRKWVAVIVAVLASAVVLNVYLILASRPAWRINKANFLRIERGMTVDEVSAILGGKPGDYTVLRKPYQLSFAVSPAHRVRGRPVYYHCEQWFSDSGTIVLKIDDGKVTWRLFSTGRDNTDLFPDEEEFMTGK